MRITIGNYKGLTAEELVDRDPGYAEWFWQHATQAPRELRQEVRAALAEFQLARLSYQYDREVEKLETLKRQRARGQAPGSVRRGDQFREAAGRTGSRGNWRKPIDCLPKRTGNWKRSRKSSRSSGRSMPAWYALSRRRVRDHSSVCRLLKGPTAKPGGRRRTAAG